MICVFNPLSLHSNFSCCSTMRGLLFKFSGNACVAWDDDRNRYFRSPLLTRVNTGYHNAPILNLPRDLKPVSWFLDWSEQEERLAIQIAFKQYWTNSDWSYQILRCKLSIHGEE